MSAPQVYCAGPYSGTTEQIKDNIVAALRAALMLSGHGFMPIVPHTMGPHHGMSWDEAMERCRLTVSRLDPARDMVVLLPGWEGSKGTLEEMRLAEKLGITVQLLSEVIK